MKTKSTKSNWGGKRKNAGRPKTNTNSRKICITLDNDAISKLDLVRAKSRGKFISDLILKYTPF